MRRACLIALVCSCSSHAGDGAPDAAVTASDAAADALVVGTWTVDPPCTATVDGIYTTPALPALTPATRGAIVTCALGDLLTVADVQTTLDHAGIAVTATTGVRVIKLAYRTVRSDGRETVSTASAYLPVMPREVPAPTILVGRSTAGIADSCAPSRDDLPQDTYALPLAARGFVTITPDYAGLGNEGTHAYLDNHEAATELFDAARAARVLVPGNVVGNAVAAIGYSQGGGVVLSAQALEYSLTGTRALRAVAAIAPEWPISTQSFDYEKVLRHPDDFTGFAGLSPPVVTVLRQYGYTTNHMAAGHAGDTFPATERTSITNAIESLCTVQLGGSLNAQQIKLGELTDATFRAQVLACIDGTSVGCTGLGAEFHAWLTSDFVTADPAGAPVMIAQGLADQVMPAAGEAACIVDKLHADGLDPALCTDATATHESVVARRIGDVTAWLEAKIDGLAAPTCASQTLPSCSR